MEGFGLLPLRERRWPWLSVVILGVGEYCNSGTSSAFAMELHNIGFREAASQHD